MRVTTSFYAASLFLAALAAPAAAEDEEHVTTAGSLRIVHAWARAAESGGETVVFMEIENSGAPDRLTGGATPLAEAVHIVGLTLSGAEIAVAEVGPIEVPAGELALDPGGLALELHGLKRPLEAGGDFELTLSFAAAGNVVVDVDVEAADARQHSHAGHAH